MKKPLERVELERVTLDSARDIALRNFVRESNRIEGILREPTPQEIAAHERLLSRSQITVLTLTEFVAVVAPGKPLRDKLGMNCRVGKYTAPLGGSEVVHRLREILWNANNATRTPWEIHCLYETLHPFMDGNGRSGRALWLWMMGGIENVPLGFLHTFYYQTLENSEGRK
jgi:hypothetical protein